MQMLLDLGPRRDIEQMRECLREMFGPIDTTPWLTPIGQLVKSMISSQTLDAVSLKAFLALKEAYPAWGDIACADPEALAAVIAAVNRPLEKAIHLKQTMQLIAKTQPDFDLSFLGAWPESGALAWLEALPGVGPKVAASTLNFSTMLRPVFVADTHVIRVLQRIGMIKAGAQAGAAYAFVTGAAPDLTSHDLTELHAWTKRLGQLVCRPQQPHCQDCPLRPQCAFGRA